MPEEFQEKVARGGGHVGLSKSIAMIGDGLGWKLNKIQQEIEPVIADYPTKSAFFKVRKGEVLGLRQYGYGIRGGERVITLTSEMFLGAKDYDWIRIEGYPRSNSSLRVASPGMLPPLLGRSTPSPGC